ncbi:hypothetical protein GQR58_019562 [Nymphon striatum]|nr:hypothetical protein GQR58_019562 [Nymphon striatum]
MWGHTAGRSDGILIYISKRGGAESLVSLTEVKIYSREERILLSLPVRYRGMRISIIANIARNEYINSKIITAEHQQKILSQQEYYNIDLTGINEIRMEIKKKRIMTYESTSNELRLQMTMSQIWLNDVNQEKGTSCWLTTLPIKDIGYSLSKRKFFDAIRLRYGWPLNNIPSKCACGDGFTTQHAFSCKKGGFVTQRHNQLRNITKKHVPVGSDRLFDIELIYSRIIGVQASARNLNLQDLFSYELAPVPTSMFKDSGAIRFMTDKVKLKRLQVETSVRTILIDATVIDGSALLWIPNWPTKGTVADLIAGFKSLIEWRLRHGDGQVWYLPKSSR